MLYYKLMWKAQKRYNKLFYLPFYTYYFYKILNISKLNFMYKSIAKNIFAPYHIIFF